MRGGLGKLADTKLCHKSSHEIVSPCHNRRPTRSRSKSTHRPSPSPPIRVRYRYRAVCTFFYGIRVTYIRFTCNCRSTCSSVQSCCGGGVRPTLGLQAAESASPSVAPCVDPKQTLLPNKHPCEEGKKRVTSLDPRTREKLTH